MTNGNSDNEQQNNSPPRSPVVDDTDYYSLESNNDNGENSNSSPLTVQLEKEMAIGRYESTVMSFICRLKVNAYEILVLISAQSEISEPIKQCTLMQLFYILATSRYTGLTQMP